MVTPSKDLHWLAGLLEGEGSFGITRNTTKGHVYLYPIIQLQMVDEDIVQRAATLLGSYCSRYKAQRTNQQAYWRTSLNCARAAAWMETLYPLLGKRRQAQIRRALKVSQRDKAIRKALR